MSIHVWHHFDADGFCAASVILGFLNMENSFIKPKSEEGCVFTQVLEHSYPMEWNKVTTGDIIFIVDYSFTRNDDIEKILQWMDKVTIIWIDHHTSSDKLIKEYPELEKLAKNGLVYTGEPKYSGCYLTYWYMIWNNSERANIEGNISELSIKDLLDVLASEPIPAWVRLVSDYDTFSHKFNGSTEFVKALGFVGLKNCFYSDNESYEMDGVLYSSFNNNLVSWARYYSFNESWVDDTLRSCFGQPNEYVSPDTIAREGLDSIKIRKLIAKGKSIIEIMSVYDAKDIKSNAYEVELSIPDSSEESCSDYKSYKILVINKKGNSQMFGDKYYEYDAVVTMFFNGQMFTHSIFSNDEGLNCEEVAVFFKDLFGITGGGHVHAAGFCTPTPVFVKNTRCILQKDIYNKLIVNEENGKTTEITTDGNSISVTQL